MIFRGWFATHFALAILLIGACSLADEGVSAVNPPSKPGYAPTLDLLGDIARIESYVRDLDSDHQVVWRKALIRLAAAGPSMLPALESSDAARTDSSRARVKKLLALALEVTITPSDLERHQGLQDLAAAGIRRGYELADSVADLSHFDIGESDSPMSEGPTRVQTIYREAGRLGGLIVPAGSKLCDDPRPATRVYGAYFLRDVLPARERIDLMVADKTPVRIEGSDWGGTTTVGKAIVSHAPGRSYGRLSDYLEDLLTRLDIMEGTYTGMFELGNGLRQMTSFEETTTWDSCWAAIDSTWNRWWELSGSEPSPTNPQEWKDYLSRPEGFYFHARRTRKDAATIFEIDGPAGTRCSVQGGKTSIQDALLPIRIRRTPNWTRHVPGAGYEVRAIFPNGSEWRGSLDSRDYEDVTLTLLGTPNR